MSGPGHDELRRWREQGRAPAGSCPFCASRISVIERDGVFVARCSHRGCGARGPKHHDLTRACDLLLPAAEDGWRHGWHRCRRCAVSHESICSVCSRPTGFGDEERFEPPVNLARCPAPGGLECRAVAQAVAPLRCENEVLRSNSDHLSSENASLARQVESMAMRIESLAEELAKPEDVRLREVLDALDGRFPIFDSVASRVSAALDEAEEFIGRAGEAERMVEAARRSLSSVAESMTEHAYQELASALESPPRIAGKTAGFDQPGREHTVGDALGLRRDR